MVTRRGFAACGLCAALGLTASKVEAQSGAAPTGGVTRHILQRTDIPSGPYEAVLVMAEIAAGATVDWHTHPGVESAYVMEGEGELSVRSQPDKQLKVAEGFQVPAETPHRLRNGNRPMKLAITYTVEKGKPLASPASG
jgi:quercetin dioxygenase-like cupin family protein